MLPYNPTLNALARVTEGFVEGCAESRRGGGRDGCTTSAKMADSLASFQPSPIGPL